jgi:peptidyl-Lys metalloendopeptidase
MGGLVGAALLGACGEPMEPLGQEQAEQQAYAEGAIKASLSVDKASLSASEDLRVTVTLTNVSSHPVSLLEWNTPAKGLTEDLFVLTLNGERVEYEGPHFKRPAPQAEHFITLAPGESLTRTVGLTGFYDLSRSGQYTLRYEVGAEHGHGAGMVAALESNEASVYLQGRANPMLQQAAAQGTVRAAALSYTNCTTTRQSSIATAFSSAQSITNNSVTYLNGTPGAKARYTTWFGAYSLTNWNTAKAHFAAIKSAFDTKAVVVDCSCTQSYYAYVYPSQPYKIYVCSAFWSAPNTGTDSKSGTLVHEMSHFTVVAATDDWAYGQSAAKSLATSNPTRALDNADSHEYFAENTPFQN